MALTDYLVNDVAWTYNINVIKLGYSLLKLLTGKSCNSLGLTMGNEAWESVSDIEVVQKVMERILKTQAEIRETEMKIKLKDCQKVKRRDYQHRDKYVEGNKVYYQYQD